MKRKILLATAISAAFLITGCSMVNMNSDQFTEEQTAYLKIQLKNFKRTALPVVDSMDEIESFSLIGKLDGVNVIDELYKSNTDGSKTAYEKLGEAEILAQVGKTYDFTMTAKKGGAIWKGSTKAKINSGANTLSFSLKIDSIGATDEDVLGTLNIELKIPSTVRTVTTSIYNADGTAANFNVLSYSYEDNLETGIYKNLGQFFAYYSNTLPTGNYVVLFKMYGDDNKTLKLGEWREYAGIAASVKSESFPVINSAEELESIYSINLILGGGNITGTVPGSYTRFSDDILLPAADKVSRDTFVFKGWSETDQNGNLNGDAITSIVSGSTGNFYIQADWAESGIHADENGTAFHINFDEDASGAQIVAW